MYRWTVLLILAGVLVIPQSVSAETAVRRFALAAGANSGGPDRVPLRYAVSDAEHFVQVLEHMGGLEFSDRVLLANPDLKAFRNGLDMLREKVRLAGQQAGRTEVLIYYSGHADENGLMLGKERFSYRLLRDQMDALQADVHITVLDACASGAITRLKGGQRQKAFMVDASSDMKGHAFLTSSSEDEAAQESDRIEASFFTHYLVSGMRGAADVSGDGRVTLNEAYQFAFHETLARTTETQGGAQHPAYDINLVGTGDVVMTDVRQTSAGLVLAEELHGRFFIRNANQQLVAELFKPAGRRMELGLEPGTYDIRLEQKQDLFISALTLEESGQVVLSNTDFNLSSREPTVARGGATRARGLAKRSRLELRAGYWNPREKRQTSNIGTVLVSQSAENIMGSLSYTYWPQENLSTYVALTGLVVEAGRFVGTQGVSNDAVVIYTLLFGLRFYLPAPRPETRFRPYLTAGVGPFFAIDAKNETGVQVVQSAKTLGTVGGQIGGGIDFPIGRHFLLGANMGYNVMMDFSETLGGRKNYSGIELGMGFSWVFGKGVREGR